MQWVQRRMVSRRSFFSRFLKLLGCSSRKDLRVIAIEGVSSM